MRFWLDRGVDGFRLDTVNFYFHDEMLRDNAPDFRPGSQDGAVPYEMQYHLYSKNQPETLAFLQRIRCLVDQYPDRARVGEVGDTHHAIKLMGEYTSGGRLHMAYAFEMLGKPLSPSHFRSQIDGFFAGAAEGWPCWAFSNHDVPRHASRWAINGTTPDGFAKLCAAMLLSFEGTICLYQGEELGLTETELAFDEILDPQGLAFWPDDKGRDGCRTPMTWDSQALHAGFSAAERTWLPIKSPQQSRSLDRHAGDESVLALYRRMIELRRRHEAMRSGRTRFVQSDKSLLVFWRGEDMFCAFNLSKDSQAAAAPDGVVPILLEGAGFDNGRVQFSPNGIFIAAWRPTIALETRPASFRQPV